MTFGMAAWAAWLLVGAAAAAAAGLFLMKLRPPRTVVPSLLLWRRVLDESRELTFWERIRRAVSLVLTVLVAIFLALALARPMAAGGRAAGSTERVHIVIDSSLSMEARTEGGERRWDRAVAEARRLIGAAAGRPVAVSTTGDGLIEGPTTDRTLLESALDRAAPRAGAVLPPARLAGTPRAHFITDGTAARPMDPDVVIHSVFEPAPNVAITAFEVRPSLGAERAGEAYIEIANYAPAAQQVQLALKRGADVVFDGTLDVTAFGLMRQVVPIARGAHPALRARVSAEADALAADNDAVAWADRAVPLDLLVVSPEPAWLETAFAQDRNVRARIVAPGAYTRADALAADVLVFDRWAPAARPERPALAFAPPRQTPWLSAEPDAERPVEEPRPRWIVPGEHRVVAGVDPFTLTIERARGYAAPELTVVARSSSGTPLVYVGESPERRLALVTFGPDESNLASAPGFPVLLANALEWLARPEGGTRKPGLAAFESAVARITGPDGSAVPLVRTAGRTFATLHRPGLYVIEGGGARSTVAVNAGDPHLSNLSRTAVTGTEDGVPATAGLAARPWWIYCALAAFALVVLEWWSWQRRVTV